MVEFVLISPLLFLLVGGIIQLALALNYWMDMQRIANQGARWAVVARYPLPDGTTCTSSNASVHALARRTLSAQQAESEHSIHASPSASRTVRTRWETPCSVRLETDFSFVPILGIGTVTLGADAEMRIEQPPGSVYDATGDC